MRQWRWGRAHVAVFANPVFSRIPVLRDWLEVSIPTGGTYDTLNRGPSTIRDDANPFEQRFGAGLRIITDLAVPADARMMAIPGQSGNPLSAISPICCTDGGISIGWCPADPPRYRPYAGSTAMTADTSRYASRMSGVLPRQSRARSCIRR